MSPHIKYICDYLKQELSCLRGSNFDEAVRTIEQATRDAERQRKSQEAFEKIFQKLDRCRDGYAKIDMYHNQKFERSMGMLWKEETTPGRSLLRLLHISCLMFICSNMVAAELEIFAAFQDVKTTAKRLNACYGDLPIPETVWKKAKNRLELRQVILLDARAKEESDMAHAPPIIPIPIPTIIKKRPRSPGLERNRPQPMPRPPPASSKRSRMSPSSSIGPGFSVQDDYARYTPIHRTAVAEFVLTYRKWPEEVYLISPKDIGILPSLEMDPDMCATLIERAKEVARLQEAKANDDAAAATAVVQSQKGQGQQYVVT